MSSFFDNVTWPKVVLVLVVIVVPIGAFVLFPEATDRFIAVLEDWLHHGIDLVTGGEE